MAARTSWMTSLALGALLTSFATPARSAIHPDFGTLNVDKPLRAPMPVNNIAFERATTDIRVKLETAKSQTMTVTGIGLRYSGMPARRFGFYQALRVAWKFAGNGQHEWTITDRDSDELLAKIKSRSFEVAGESLRLNLKPIPGRLTLRPTTSRAAEVIASLDLESYVRGVLPAEMPSSWPLEALKAQAIAARSFALHRKKMRDAVQASYHLEAGVMDQMFLVPVLEEGADESRLKADQAVKETRGMILSDGAAPLAAFFHADCGGHTERAGNVWGDGSRGAGTTADDSCPLNPLARWRVKLTSTEIAAKLRAGTRVALLNLIPLDHTDSGRVNQMKLVWSDGAETRITAHEFRMAVGHERIKSTNFEILPAGGVFELTGNGFGHGVGLCQWGARHLAKSGKTYTEILRHYYPSARLTNLAVPGSIPVSTLAGTVEPNAAP